MALGRVSAILVDVRTMGPVQDFTLTDVGPEQHQNNGTVTKLVTVDAQVKALDGIERKTFVFTLEAREDGWLITAVK